MNKYIKTDIEQGLSFIRVAIENALTDLEKGNEEEIRFDAPIPLQLIVECAEKRGWIHEDNFINDWEYDYYMISSDKKRCLNIYGSLLFGNSSIDITNNEN